MKSTIVNRIDFFYALDFLSSSYDIQIHTSYSSQSKKYFTTYYFVFAGEIHNVAYQDFDVVSNELEFGLYDGVIHERNEK